jgi:membrane-associated phospholipid phosphatase
MGFEESGGKHREPASGHGCGADVVRYHEFTPSHEQVPNACRQDELVTTSANDLPPAREVRPARFWVHLAAGTVVLVIAAWIFGAIAEDVVNGDPLTVVDRCLANWLHAHATPAVTRAMLVASELAGPRIAVGLTLATALVLLVMRGWLWLLALVLVVPGGWLLDPLLKIAYRRARPTFEIPLLVLTDYGFPSGHTMMATLLYGFLGFFLVTRVRSWRWRGLVISVAGALVIFVGFSRIYLGAHYLSDVLAAVAAGVAWLVLCVNAVATLRDRPRRRGP